MILVLLTHPVQITSNNLNSELGLDTTIKSCTYPTLVRPTTGLKQGPLPGRTAGSTVQVNLLWNGLFQSLSVKGAALPLTDVAI